MFSHRRLHACVAIEDLISLFLELLGRGGVDAVIMIIGVTCISHYIKKLLHYSCFTTIHIYSKIKINQCLETIHKEQCFFHFSFLRMEQQLFTVFTCLFFTVLFLFLLIMWLTEINSFLIASLIVWCSF